MSDQVFEYGGQYRLLRLLAEGGMGRVFLAEQFGSSGFSKTVAIKIIHRDLVDEKMFRELFIGEAKLTADLIHENIVQVYQLVEYKQSYGIVMEYLHGTTLDGINDRLDEINDYCPPELGAFVISRVARALAYAHTKLGREGQPMGIVHRDVSPPNILVSWQGVVKLSDFGIAKAVPMHCQPSPPITSNGFGRGLELRPFNFPRRREKLGIPRRGASRARRPSRE